MSFNQPKIPSQSQGPQQASRCVCPMDNSHRLPKNVRSVLTHLIQQHGLRKMARSSLFVPHKEPLRPGVDILLVTWKFDKRDFLERISVDRHGYIRISIILIGNKHDSEQYSAELQIRPKPIAGQANASTPKILLTYPQLTIQPLRNESEPPTEDSSTVIQNNWFRINYPACMDQNYRMEWVSRLDIMKKLQFDVDEFFDPVSSNGKPNSSSGCKIST